MKTTTKYVIRGGKRYKVVDECKTQVCVEATFEYAQRPFKRKLKLWWDKQYVHEVKP